VRFLNESIGKTLRACRLFAAVAAILVPVLGCPVTSSDPRSLPAHMNTRTSGDSDLETVAKPSSSTRGDDVSLLVNRIDQVLQANLTGRQLSTEVHGAWQIMHGVLAYGSDFQVQSSEGQVRVIDHVLRGGALKGFVLRSGDRFSPPGNIPPEKTPTSTTDPLLTRGIRADMDPGTKLGQGHRDQWLAYLVSCSLPLDQVILTADGPRRLDLWAPSD
jgi:hypothetical protein